MNIEYIKLEWRNEEPSTSIRNQIKKVGWLDRLGQTLTLNCCTEKWTKVVLGYIYMDGWISQG